MDTLEAEIDFLERWLENARGLPEQLIADARCDLEAVQKQLDELKLRKAEA